jgi:Zn-dependent metalloprotease
VNGYPVEASQVITHSINGQITIVNGDFYQVFSSVQSPSLTEQAALQVALNKVNAKKYMWENVAFQQSSGFDFTPKGELVFVHKKGASYAAENMRLAYKFNIYAEQPLYRANLFIDAGTGEILDEQNLICSADVVGTAVTKYSGTVPMTSDNYSSGQYRLRETGRGNGIQTYNLNNSTTYTNTDITNNSSTWNLAGNNQACSDAHWGAEMTYDYYKNVHNRNSIDGNGYALLSYMHYSTNYANAFWNGQYMTYGDGDGTQFGIMTALDVCGHEITHGLTAFTAALGGSGSGEPGALNEAWSDIMGTSIEAHARPNQHDWLMGADISLQNSQVRDLSNEHNSGEGPGPNCYMESGYWDAANQEVHTNSGVAGHWYYLLCLGGSGTSGCGQNYYVSGITMAKAEKIAFRGLTVYFTSNTNYSNARTSTIQAATDLYGSCSAELTATTNAWYAVGVGAAYAGGFPTAVFSANNTLSCTAPLTVNFTNNSLNAASYNWNFGDGGTSTTTSPAHTYTTAGVYNVQLVATGTCSANAKDTMLINQMITVNGAPTASSPSVTSCGPKSYTLSASGVGQLTWYNSSGQVGTGSGYTTPTLTQTTTYSVTSSVYVAGTATAAGAPATATTLNAGGYLNYSHYLIFDATTPFTLKSVDVYAQTSSSSQPTIQLTDNTGAVLQAITTTLTAAGKNTVTLNWHVPQGTGYRLVAAGANINLSRNNGGATFPINVSTVASITGTDVSGTSPTYYYWFYNWIVVADVLCPSSATVVTATIQNCTGIATHGADIIAVYPNPAHNNISITAPEPIKNISVVDMIGKTILSHQPENETSVSLDVSLLPAGVYFVKVSAGESSKLVKLIKE